MCTEIEDTVAVAALTRALVWTCGRDAAVGAAELDRGRDSGEAAVWRAARYGLGGLLVDPRADRLAPAHQVVLELVEHVRDGLEIHGDLDLVTERVSILLADGNGASRQRLALDRLTEPGGVAHTLIDRTRPPDHRTSAPW